MTEISINITPRQFGNIAAEAMRHGYDVTQFLIRTALARPQAAPEGTPAPGDPSTPQDEPCENAEGSSVAPAPAGLFDGIRNND